MNNFVRAKLTTLAESLKQDIDYEAQRLDDIKAALVGTEQRLADLRSNRADVLSALQF